MQGRELLLMVDALAREKNVSRDVVFSALESALASAMKKRYKDEVDMSVQALIVEELRRLHEGVLARYGLRPAQWAAYRQALARMR